jgi:myosin-6
MDQGQKVWCPHILNGFQLGEICDFATDTISVQPLDGSKVVEIGHDDIYLAEEDGAPIVADNCGLMYLNEATLLHNLDRRFQEDLIYTYTANILLALNPYHSIDCYGAALVKQYQGKSLGVLPPHIYAIADKAYRDMRNLSLSQSIMCSGESGAGKTESTKHLLRYLTDSYGGGGDVADLESRILAANPLLESFGNAKTTRNNNSSRFGKFVELHFNRNALVIGAHILHYLLEKSRIIEQNGEERNYQVFYRMCRGAPKTMRDALNLAEDCASYEYLRHSKLEPIPFLDDVKEFAVMEKSMTDCGLDPKEKANIFRITAAVLHIGNINFEEAGDGCKVTADSETSASGVAQMLGLDAEELKSAIANKIMNIGGTETKKGLSLTDTKFNKNGLGKSLYSKLFDWIVERINTCFPFPADKSVNYIGILDIAGFEYFRHNSFEQFCINYCNEKLQQFFNQRVLKDEQELYVKEAIKFKEVEYVDNQDCIDLIEASKTGILGILDDVARAPQATETGFAEKLHGAHSKHFRLQVPRKSKMAYYKQLRDNEGFIIRHFAGAVCYEVGNGENSGFLDKNNDALTADLAFLMDESKDPFMRELFKAKPGDPKPKRGKLTLVSLGDKFKKALNVLMDKLNSTRASFVRCIKPNAQMKPKIFEGAMILSQLQCAGMVSVLDLMQGGYPSRTQFQDLYDMYASILPPELKALDPRTFAKALFKALGMNEDDFQFGVSKVFFRPGKFAEFDSIMKADPEHLKALVAKVMDWLIKARWKKITWAAVSCFKFAAKIRARAGAAIIMQNTIKMFLAKSSNRPRYLGIKELKTLTGQIEAMKETCNKFPKNKEKYLALVEGVLGDLKADIGKIRTADKISREDIKGMRESLNKKIEKNLAAIRKEQEKQKLQAEAERLRKLQEEMAKERERKMEEERKRIEAEAEAQMMKQMEEEARKEEEAEQVRQEKERIKAEKDGSNQKLQDKKNAELRREQEEAALLEQERRDQELAMRLALDAAKPDEALSDDARAQKASGGVRRKPKTKTTTTSFANKKQEQLHKKHDLSKWKYADLRDTINTSCDVDLLEACREEFHRRLKVYHAWKMKNQQKGKGGVSSRAPEALAASAKARGSAPAPPAKKKKSNTRPQRFFRIPFIRPGDKGKPGSKKGWWFAHFDGQWIARQMELHPEKSPVLLVAGRDDMEMCELSLEETGLSRKRGAEILQREFEDEWSKNGGDPYESARKK